MSVTVGLIRQALGQFGDLQAVWNTRLANLGDDETLADDVLNDMTMAGVPWAGTVAMLLPLLFLVIENNQSGSPDSQTPMHGSGSKGSIPGQTGGRI